MENDNPVSLNRRSFLENSLWLSFLMSAFPLTALSKLDESILKKEIPSTGEKIPAIGMGTWITFNIGNNKAAQKVRTEILREFFKRGGGMIDSSPMYGSAESVLGDCFKEISNKNNLFSATKVWSSSLSEGKSQIEDSFKLWGADKFDLYQVHNLLGYSDQIKQLRKLKKEGKTRYVGVTTSHGRRHDELVKIMKDEPLDFIQVTYNILDRDVEKEILPLAQKKKIAVIANRPFRRKQLIHSFQSKPLPSWSKEEAGAKNWPEFLLKFIISHPSITCTIPATSQVKHIKENMESLKGKMPSQKTREKMIKYVQSL